MLSLGTCQLLVKALPVIWSVRVSERESYDSEDTIQHQLVSSIMIKDLHPKPVFFSPWKRPGTQSSNTSNTACQSFNTLAWSQIRNKERCNISSTGVKIPPQLSVKWDVLQGIPAKLFQVLSNVPINCTFCWSIKKHQRWVHFSWPPKLCLGIQKIGAFTT